MKLSLVEKRKEAGDATSFVFKPDAPLSWQAGQFLHSSAHAVFMNILVEFVYNHMHNEIT